MSLIRKPDAKVFEDSTTVKAVRGAHTVAVEGGGSAVRATANLWLGAMLAMSMLAALGGLFSGDPFAMTFAAVWIGVGIYLLRRMFRSPTRNDAIERIDECGLPFVPAPRQAFGAAAPGETIQVRYWSKALLNKAFTLALLGVGMTLATGFLAVVGIVLVGRGVLLGATVFGHRKCLEIDRTTVTVHNLLGTKTMPLAEVESAFVHTFRKRRQDISCFVGSRKAIVITGRIAGERRHLLVPYSLLGLSREAAEELCDAILGRLAAAVPDPRRGFAAARPAPPPRPEPSCAGAPEPTFDPDAIMARYLTERQQVMEASGMPRPSAIPVQRGFGRKGLVATDDRAA